MKREETLNKIRHGIIVSCQAVAGNPLEAEVARNMLLMADCAAKGGCVGFRANSPEVVKPIKDKYPDLVMIGIWKVVSEGNPVYITPSMKEVDALVECGCEVIACDCTNEKNVDGEYAWTIIKKIHDKYPDVCVMADIDTLDDALIAYREGADIISTTMNGYTPHSIVKHTPGSSEGTANFELLRQIKEKAPDCFLLHEGRIWTREDCVEAFRNGADCICVGKSITNPYKITERFVNAVNTYFGE